MKIRLLTLLCVGIVALSGCSRSNEKLEAIEPIAPETETEEETTLETPEEEVPSAPEETIPAALVTPGQTQITYEVQLIDYAQQAYATQEPELLLAQCTYAVPHMIAVAQDGTVVEDAPIVATFNAGFADWDNGGNFAELLSWAQESYTWNQENESDYNVYHYTDELECSVYQAGNYISISGMYYSYTGGAHPNTWLLSWLFDTNTGAFISPLTLATDSQALLDGITNQLVVESVERAAEYDLLPEELFWPDYQEVLADWPSYAVTFDATGMTIGFSPYELAAYAAGSQVFTISYAELTPYFSAETIALLSGEVG